MKGLLIITGSCLIMPLLGNPAKTRHGLKRGILLFLRILPTILSFIIVISILLYLLPEQKIALWFGDESGVMGYVTASLMGSVSLIQGFIAYPMAGVLVRTGVGYPVIAIFITTLMILGIMTLPVAAGYFGIRVAIARNSLALVFALVVGFLMGLIWNLF